MTQPLRTVTIPINFSALELECPECHYILLANTKGVRGVPSTLRCSNVICSAYNREYAWPTIQLTVVHDEANK